MAMWLTLAVLASIGCGQATTTAPPPLPAVAQTALAPSAESQVAETKTPPAEGQADKKPGKPGVDWPTFLGPNGDSKSPEKGILMKWPVKALRIVWQRKLGEGYGIGSIAKGKLYQADRIDDKARLVCLDAVTGDEIWTKEYVTTYVDIVRLRRWPALLADRRWRSRLYVRRRRDAALPSTRQRRREMEARHDQAVYHVVQNFFGVGSFAGH